MLRALWMLFLLQARVLSESKSAGRVCRDGLRSGERLPAPVAENRDVQTHLTCPRWPGPGKPLYRNHRQDYRRAGGWARPLGPAVGHGGGEGAAGDAAQRRNAAQILRDNRAVVRAASAASKASDFLLGFLPQAIDAGAEGNAEAA